MVVFLFVAETKSGSKLGANTNNQFSLVRKKFHSNNAFLAHTAQTSNSGKFITFSYPRVENSAKLSNSFWKANAKH